MPKESRLPEYGNQQIKALIMEYVHDITDRKMLYLRLVDGLTFEEIAGRFGLTTKTARVRIHKQEAILFSHLPG